jgi:cytochrome o ubiquinol oxidase subunit 1
MWWLAAASFVALLAVAIHHTFNYDREFRISADHVRSVEVAR